MTALSKAAGYKGHTAIIQNMDPSVTVIPETLGGKSRDKSLDKVGHYTYNKVESKVIDRHKPTEDF
jgi:hypothetical protein